MTGSHPAALDLGVLSLVAEPEWRFYPLDDCVVGRPSTGVGLIQLRRLPLDAVPWPTSHEMCMSAASAASGYAIEPPGFDRALERELSCMAGGESFRSGNDFVRIWYRHCPDGMVAAWFAFPQHRAPERTVRDHISQCDRMISTVRVAPPLS